jgi:prepilin-type N-terminal cleavage/methylation domain-containing protein
MRRATSGGGVARGFSLVELLMAIFILGIGIISIAALFPAGIVQQRQSVDDMVGPLVAQNAMAVLRGKLRQVDFGTREEHGFATQTIHGDWGWSRPAFFGAEVEVDDPFGSSDIVIPAGSISIFRGDNTDPAAPSATDTEVPWSSQTYAEPPLFVFTPGERAYPQYSVDVPLEDQAAPQYVWDCMFRRFQGRVYVAVFVYRVTNPPGQGGRYVVASNPSNSTVPPLPIWLEMHTDFDYCKGCPWGAGPTWNIIDGCDPDDYSPYRQDYSWQEPRQWLLDQDMSVHYVLGRFVDDEKDLTQVELRRAPSMMPNLPAYFCYDPAVGLGEPVFDKIVTAVWYLPTVDALGRTLTPAYLMVEEL